MPKESSVLSSEPPPSPHGASVTPRLGFSRLQGISPLASSPPGSRCTQVSAVSSLLIFLLLCLKICRSVLYLSASGSLSLTISSPSLFCSPLSGAGLCMLLGPCARSPQTPANLCLHPLCLSCPGLCLTLYISGLVLSLTTLLSTSLFSCCVCLSFFGCFKEGKHGLVKESGRGTSRWGVGEGCLSIALLVVWTKGTTC